MTVVVNDDGYLIVDVGDGAQMTCPTGALEWRLRYGDKPVMIAAGVVESFRYLLLECSQKEAQRRMKIMRDAMRTKKQG